MGFRSSVFVRDMESWEALRDGGPTKRVGAGNRLGNVFAVGEDLLLLVGAVEVLALLDMM